LGAIPFIESSLRSILFGSRFWVIKNFPVRHLVQ
jgi:hypothetical protein